VSKRLGVTRVAHVPLELFRKDLHSSGVAVWRFRAVRCRATSLALAPSLRSAAMSCLYRLPRLLHTKYGLMRCNRLPELSACTQIGSPRRAFKNGKPHSPVRSICLKVWRRRKLNVQVVYQR
jgi:hypothetical protein